MDARLSAEQRDLRAAAAKLADSLGPQSVHDLSDDARVARLEKAVAATGWRRLRSDGAGGVEAAIVAEEFARGLVDVPYLGPVLADGLQASSEPTTIAVDGVAIDARGMTRALVRSGISVGAARLGDAIAGVDLTKRSKELIGPLEQVAVISAEHVNRWQALALVATTADLLGAARGAHALACDYAKVRAQYGHPIGTYQAVSHPLAEGLALIEGSISVLRYAAWAVDETKPEDAIRTARIAKVYCARAARTVCETSIQVHGGIGNTWDCLAHVYLRRVLAATALFPVRLQEVDCGLS